MNTARFLTFWTLTLTTIIVAVRVSCADGEIVYGTRYYARPGTRLHTRFHLYLVSANGKGRRQLTFGTDDDTDPIWSPDGRTIVYESYPDVEPLTATPVRLFDVRLRKSRLLSKVKNEFQTFSWTPDGKTIICNGLQGVDDPVTLIDARTGVQRILNNVYDYRVSPDGSFVCVRTSDGYRVEGRKGRLVALLPKRVTSVAWISRTKLVGIMEQEDMPVAPMYALYDLHGNELIHRLIHLSKDVFVDQNQLENKVIAESNDKRLFLFGVWEHNSSNGNAYDFYTVNIADGTTKPFTTGNHLSFAPNGTRFCSDQWRNLTRYTGTGKKERDVWTSPLQIGTLGVAGRIRLKTLTPPLTWVIGVDWCPAPRY